MEKKNRMRINIRKTQNPIRRAWMIKYKSAATQKIRGKFANNFNFKFSNEFVVNY